MIFSSKTVAILIGLFVSILSTISCIFASPEDITTYIIIALSSFFSAYVSTYLLLEFVFFRELRNVYQKIMDLEGSSRKDAIHSIKDFSFNKMSDELLHYSENKTKELKKMKEIETFRRQFLADIAHELKTPVHTAQGFVETLVDGAIDDLNVRDRFLLKTKKSLNSLNFIINDLINISHLETGEITLDIKEINLKEIIYKVTQHLEQKAKKKNHTIYVEVDKDINFSVLADDFRIEQVLTNLISNAINYSGEGKKIWVTLKKVSQRQCEVNIIDNGQGIPKEHRSKIFNRFYRVDKSRSREHGGTGLGLAIVKHILEAHNSQIILESKKGKGANFSFRLNFVH